MLDLSLSLCLCLAFSGLALAADAPPAGLSVAKAGPTGEVSSLASANEVRVVFSDAMVALGRIPEVVQAPYFKIVPPVPGRFRWSGTKLLIFTPAKGTTLPFGTKYTVTIDATAASMDGKKLAAPYVFSFTTPTVKLGTRIGTGRRAATTRPSSSSSISTSPCGPKTWPSTWP